MLVELVWGKQTLYKIQIQIQIPSCANTTLTNTITKSSVTSWPTFEDSQIQILFWKNTNIQVCNYKRSQKTNTKLSVTSLPRLFKGNWTLNNQTLRNTVIYIYNTWKYNVIWHKFATARKKNYVWITNIKACVCDFPYFSAFHPTTRPPYHLFDHNHLSGLGGLCQPPV